MASDTVPIRLDQAIREARYDPRQVLSSSVPDEDMTLGGGVLTWNRRFPISQAGDLALDGPYG
jgi:hypothetical protein